MIGMDMFSMFMGYIQAMSALYSMQVSGFAWVLLYTPISLSIDIA